MRNKSTGKNDRGEQEVPYAHWHVWRHCCLYSRGRGLDRGAIGSRRPTASPNERVHQGAGAGRHGRSRRSKDTAAAIVDKTIKEHRRKLLTTIELVQVRMKLLAQTEAETQRYFV